MVCHTREAGVNFIFNQPWRMPKENSKKNLFATLILYAYDTLPNIKQLEKGTTRCTFIAVYIFQMIQIQSERLSGS